MEPTKIELEQRGNDWIAYVWGRGAPIVRPVPRNTRPANRAEWRSRDEAVAELTAWFGAIVVVQETYTP